LTPRKRDAFELDFTVQGVGIEEPGRADELDAGGLASLFFLDQKQLVIANMFGAELVGRPSKVFGKLGD
jgi:hypothetical protein